MLKVGTDFSGIGSPEAALKRLNLPHKNVFACEIDKFAKQSYLELNDPDTFYEDITTRNHSEVEQLDLYVAGFPCQSFSTAGKRGGFDDVRGTLFFNVAEFIKVNQPKCFILENVRGLLSHDKGRTFQVIIDLLSNGGGTINGQMSFDSVDDGLGYHIYYKVLNTKDYGIPQNRERIFIVGFRNFRSYKFPKPIFLDKRLKHFLEDNADAKYYLSDKMIKGFLRHNKRHIEEKNQTGFNWKPKNVDDIANCLRANGALAPTDNSIIIHNLHPRCGDPKKGGTGHLSKTDGITYCLDAANSIAVELPYKYEKEIKQSINQDIATCIDASYYKGFGVRQGKCRQVVKRENNIRRLTPLETWRLQGFTDEEFYKAQKVNSDTQLYKQAGNSITVNVMVELFKKIYLK